MNYRRNTLQIVFFIFILPGSFCNHLTQSQNSKASGNSQHQSTGSNNVPGIEFPVRRIFGTSVQNTINPSSGSRRGVASGQPGLVQQSNLVTRRIISGGNSKGKHESRSGSTSRPASSRKSPALSLQQLLSQQRILQYQQRLASQNRKRLQNLQRTQNRQKNRNSDVGHQNRQSNVQVTNSGAQNQAQRSRQRMPSVIKGTLTSKTISSIFGSPIANPLLLANQNNIHKTYFKSQNARENRNTDINMAGKTSSSHSAKVANKAKVNQDGKNAVRNSHFNVNERLRAQNGVRTTGRVRGNSPLNSVAGVSDQRNKFMQFQSAGNHNKLKPDQVSNINRFHTPNYQQVQNSNTNHDRVRTQKQLVNTGERTNAGNKAHRTQNTGVNSASQPNKLNNVLNTKLSNNRATGHRLASHQNNNGEPLIDQLLNANLIDLKQTSDPQVQGTSPRQPNNLHLHTNSASTQQISQNVLEQLAQIQQTGNGQHVRPEYQPTTNHQSSLNIQQMIPLLGQHLPTNAGNPPINNFGKSPPANLISTQEQQMILQLMHSRRQNPFLHNNIPMVNDPYSGLFMNYMSPEMRQELLFGDTTDPPDPTQSTTTKSTTVTTTPATTISTTTASTTMTPPLTTPSTIISEKKSTSRVPATHFAANVASVTLPVSGSSAQTAADVGKTTKYIENAVKEALKSSGVSGNIKVVIDIPGPAQPSQSLKNVNSTPGQSNAVLQNPYGTSVHYNIKPQHVNNQKVISNVRTMNGQAQPSYQSNTQQVNNQRVVSNVRTMNAQAQPSYQSNTQQVNNQRHVSNVQTMNVQAQPSYQGNTQQVNNQRVVSNVQTMNVQSQPSYQGNTQQVNNQNVVSNVQTMNVQSQPSYQGNTQQVNNQNVVSNVQTMNVQSQPSYQGNTQQVNNQNVVSNVQTMNVQSQPSYQSNTHQVNNQRVVSNVQTMNVQAQPNYQSNTHQVNNQKVMSNVRTMSVQAKPSHRSISMKNGNFFAQNNNAPTSNVAPVGPRVQSQIPTLGFNSNVKNFNHNPSIKTNHLPLVQFFKAGIQNSKTNNAVQAMKQNGGHELKRPFTSSILNIHSNVNTHMNVGQHKNTINFHTTSSQQQNQNPPANFQLQTHPGNNRNNMVASIQHGKPFAPKDIQVTASRNNKFTGTRPGIQAQNSIAGSPLKSMNGNKNSIRVLTSVNRNAHNKIQGTRSGQNFPNYSVGMKNSQKNPVKVQAKVLNTAVIRPQVSQNQFSMPTSPKNKMHSSTNNFVNIVNQGQNLSEAQKVTAMNNDFSKIPKVPNKQRNFGVSYFSTDAYTSAKVNELPQGRNKQQNFASVKVSSENKMNTVTNKVISKTSEGQKTQRAFSGSKISSDKSSKSDTNNKLHHLQNPQHNSATLQVSSKTKTNFRQNSFRMPVLRNTNTSKNVISTNSHSIVSLPSSQKSFRSARNKVFSKKAADKTSSPKFISFKFSPKRNLNPPVNVFSGKSFSARLPVLSKDPISSEANNVRFGNIHGHNGNTFQNTAPNNKFSKIGGTFGQAGQQKSVMTNIGNLGSSTSGNSNKNNQKPGVVSASDSNTKKSNAPSVTFASSKRSQLKNVNQGFSQTFGKNNNNFLHNNHPVNEGGNLLRSVPTGSHPNEVSISSRDVIGSGGTLETPLAPISITNINTRLMHGVPNMPANSDSKQKATSKQNAPYPDMHSTFNVPVPKQQGALSSVKGTFKNEFPQNMSPSGNKGHISNPKVHQFLFNDVKLTETKTQPPTQSSSNANSARSQLQQLILALQAATGTGSNTAQSTTTTPSTTKAASIPSPKTTMEAEEMEPEDMPSTTTTTTTQSTTLSTTTTSNPMIPPLPVNPNILLSDKNPCPQDKLFYQCRGKPQFINVTKIDKWCYFKCYQGQCVNEVCECSCSAPPVQLQLFGNSQSQVQGHVIGQEIALAMKGSVKNPMEVNNALNDIYSSLKNDNPELAARVTSNLPGVAISSPHEALMTTNIKQPSVTGNVQKSVAQTEAPAQSKSSGITPTDISNLLGAIERMIDAKINQANQKPNQQTINYANAHKQIPVPPLREMILMQVKTSTTVAPKIETTTKSPLQYVQPGLPYTGESLKVNPFGLPENANFLMQQYQKQKHQQQQHQSLQHQPQQQLLKHQQWQNQQLLHDKHLQFQNQQQQQQQHTQTNQEQHVKLTRSRFGSLPVVQQQQQQQQNQPQQQKQPQQQHHNQQQQLLLQQHMLKLTRSRFGSLPNVQTNPNAQSTHTNQNSHFTGGQPHVNGSPTQSWNIQQPSQVAVQNGADPNGWDIGFKRRKFEGRGFWRHKKAQPTKRQAPNDPNINSEGAEGASAEDRKR